MPQRTQKNDRVPPAAPLVHFVYHPEYYCDIGVHVFPMRKFGLVRDRLAREARLGPERFLEPEPATDADLARVHTPAYLEAFLNLRQTAAVLSSELPISAEIVRAYRRMTGGTMLAFRTALQSCGCAVNLGGGFHHAFAGRAEGFCYINDVAVAVRAVQAAELARRFVIVDVDLHQGNGTAAIFRDEPAVFTFSIHQEHLYPRKERGDLDIGLDFNAGDDEYLRHLRTQVPRILDEHKPDLVVYVAGADPYEEDQLGQLKLTKAGLGERDHIVFGAAHVRNLPVAAVLAGGYARDMNDTVDIHYRMCQNALQEWEN